MAARLDEHMLSNNLYIDNQFGYRKGHSAETLLPKVMNDLLLSCDDNMPSVLILLDLSAAFDTVDHSLLLNILKNEIGIMGIALDWFTSFLTERKSFVKINDAYSFKCAQNWGVPQGSVLGPVLFNIYIRGLYKFNVIRSFNIEGFADDNQLTKKFLVQLQVEALGDNIRNCIENISRWMHKHFLWLNADKTKILVIAPPKIQEQIVIRGVMFDNNCIRFVNSAKNLGVILDDTLSFAKQIQKATTSSYFVIRKISSIRAFLDQEQLKTLICTKIFSQIDYCNSLYFGLPAKCIVPLQQVQNSALRLILKGKLPFNSHSTPYFIKMHWLKVRERIIFKLIVISKNVFGPINCRH